jgi:hypothetical protein
MRSSALLACAALAAAASGARGDPHGIRLVGGGLLGVVDGRVVAIDPAHEDHDWTLLPPRSRTTTTTMQYFGNTWGGRRLAYDPEARGKDQGAVFLGRGGPGPGTEWLLTQLEGEPGVYTVQAASGTVKGWYLDVEAKGKEFKDRKGKQAMTYRVFLREKPKKIPKWNIVEVSR